MQHDLLSSRNASQSSLAGREKILKASKRHQEGCLGRRRRDGRDLLGTEAEKGWLRCSSDRKRRSRRARDWREFRGPVLELYALGEEVNKLAYYFPGVEFKIEQQWGEAWSKPPDWIPIVGKVSEHVTSAIGMGDQGIIMSWLSDSKIPMIIKGGSDWFTEMASPTRFGHSNQGAGPAN